MRSFTSLFFIEVGQTNNYFLLDILCLFLFFPLGIASKFYRVNTNVNLFFY